ncbi:alpha-hydroxy-acid oxidizing protein [Rouxiella silvae]|uniref:Alpha-hydroxy-acid oxidizing protein n=1 Tax=Rouxiella silvae TaxID=1646373 RepID=A0AA40X0L0_9GAMM|nr:alpha-hydroxy acid oxidase [Rouxiella silvae]MBF6636456.1 alpha-hydroxy-acid oxidizing protein [Rouxiella silvae]
MTSSANESSIHSGVKGAVSSTGSLANSAPVTSKVPRKFSDLLALQDFERHARRRLPNMIYQYVAGGVETGRGIQGNYEAYQQYAFVPRMFVDVSGRSQSVELFGHTYSHPFGVAPLGGASFVSYRADISLAKAARAMNTPMILSASSLIRLEDVYEANPDAWFQAYLAGDQPRIDRLVERVANAGFKTLVVTGDTPMLGNREHNTRSGFSMPIKLTPKVCLQSALSPRWLFGTVAQTFLRHGAPHFENTDAERGPPMMSSKVRNTQARDKLNWKHVDAIRKLWKGNLVVKGLMSPDDAFIARDLGVDAVILSNHGGRQLDYTVPPLHTLPEIAAKKGSMKVIIDSGIRRGTDVMKAMALGADFTFLGRPFLYGAVIGGQAGVEHAMHILRDEIDRDLALIGVRSPAELHGGLLRRAPYYGQGSQGENYGK